MFASLSPARRRFVLVLAAALAAIAAVMAAIAIREVGSGAVDPVAQDEPGPVLLVSGYGGSAAPVEALARQLRVQGRDASVVPPVGNGTADLRTQAEQLDGAARRAMTRTAAGSVDVVGYSAGGVVARLWVRDFDGASKARRVLSLGSPQHGTSVAEQAVGTLPGRCPKACGQLAPDSDLLRGLNAGDETPRGPVFISIWSTSDEVVTPPDTARLAGATNFTIQSVCANARVSHAQVPSNKVVRGVVAQVLGPDAPRVPSASDCGGFSS